MSSPTAAVFLSAPVCAVNPRSPQKKSRDATQRLQGLPTARTNHTKAGTLRGGTAGGGPNARNSARLCPGCMGNDWALPVAGLRQGASRKRAEPAKQNLCYSVRVSEEMESESSVTARYPHPSASGFFAPVSCAVLAGGATDTRPARERSPLGAVRAFSPPAASRAASESAPVRFKSLTAERSMNPINVSALAQRVRPVVQIHDGQPITTSVEVARVFGKRHDHVMRAIEYLISQLDAERLPNFGETFTTRPNPNGGEPIKSPAYHLTKDAVALLTFGFTGKRALAFKLAYIDAFNKMEAALAEQTQPASPAALPASDVLIPDDVQAAIDAKAWELSAQAHRIVHRRLRLLTESTACGYPQRTINSEEALAHIAATTLDDAFVPLAPDLYSMQLLAQGIADSAQRYADAVNKGITALRQRDVLLAPVLNAA